ncbi:MAG: cutL 2 [Blastococcus sp.]|jgi:carbon-monoxide dehydrogenase large subunit|nr:cutL 2 [Blastococcus sp.]
MTAVADTPGVAAPGLAAVAGRWMGQSVPRKEDPRLLAGRGRYLDDIVVPGMLHAAFVRSDVARGRIVGVDAEAARALPGVRAVFTAADLNPLVHETWWSMAGKDAVYAPKFCLAEGDVRFVGDPVAIVVADSRYIAEDAVDLVELEVEAGDPVLDVDAARAAGATLVHPELGTNVASAMPKADVPGLQETFDSAATVVSETFVQHRYLPVPMETRGLLAQWDPFSEELDVWAATQSAHELRAFFSRMLGIPESRVRVRTPDVGGGFGQKVFALRDEWAVVLASKLLGLPVKFVEDRRENLIAASSARDDRMSMDVAVDADGTFLAFRAELVENVGAYPFAGSGSAAPLVAMCLPGPYTVPAVGFSGDAVFTNTTGRAPYRGPFLMETVVPEQIVDVVARRIGMDPLELRRRNVIQSSQLPYQLPTGLVYTGVTPAETLEQAAELIDYAGFRAQQEAARAEGRLLGIGISLCVEPSAIAFGALSTEGAVLKMEGTGTFNLVLGSSSTGMSVETTMRQVAAEHLGCHIDQITVTQGDTAMTPYGAGTQGSRSAVLYGNVTREVSLEVRDKILRIAAHMLEASPDDLDIADGQVAVRGVPQAAVTFEQVAMMAYQGTAMLPPDLRAGVEAYTRFTAPMMTFVNACHICTVEVDADTGKVEILRYVVSEDCGQMINPKVVEGQVAGGVVQGIGGVLYESFVYDDVGNPLTGSFVDYLLPTAAEVPDIEYGHIESGTTNALGVKGVGEGGAVASPPAIFNAVADALAPLGVELRSTPLGPRQILDALAAAGH